MDKWIIILIVCVALFLLSFCLLYSKKLAKFFKTIGGGIKSFFQLFTKNKVKLTKEQKKNRPEKSALQTRPVLLLPNATKKEESKVIENKESSIEQKKQNAQETIKLGGKFVEDNKEILEAQNFEDKKKKMKDDFDRFLDELEDDNSDEEDIKNFFSDSNQEDSNEENLEEEFKIKVKQSNSVNVDGNDVDLSKLPPKIRRLLLSGMLDRKDNE